MASNLQQSHDSHLLNHCIRGMLPPEVDNEGNIEYKVFLGKNSKALNLIILIFFLKLKLVNLTTERVEHLVTQMKWRYIKQ